MKWDAIDRGIIVLLATGEKTITELINDVWELSGGTDRRRADATMRYRLQKLIDEGYIAMNRETKQYSMLNCEVVQGEFIGKRISTDEVVQIPMDYTILLYDKENLVGILPVNET